MEGCVHISVQNHDFDITHEQANLLAQNKNIGALVSFTGLCRDESGRLDALEIEHYPGMAEAQIEKIALSAKERFSLDAVRIIHRFGMIKPGENIVLVIAASRHRNAAFEAASFLMDYMKTNAPFWKKEHLKNGASGHWVSSRASDDQAKKRWNEE
ncbi:molybdopterin synthase catalytic subunit [Paenochrobactrum gallinarii]|uniref:Molybdopterin synthase catalytic subunit n=1 Tax=Paenochrobactrum gallinarii TaxID=643673 RepID=A0A841LX33_9HYPH|nr:molybdenum cofactor biosynthesis protein MoaE [Paenochrobactrum gallinarii]MBB6260209.1 molybdopterin synthase catalytic subunit [Paenochrobactrum gallinarii]